jgi:transcription elongation factor Elf1
MDETTFMLTVTCPECKKRFAFRVPYDEFVEARDNETLMRFYCHFCNVKLVYKPSVNKLITDPFQDTEPKKKGFFKKMFKK